MKKEILKIDGSSILGKDQLVKISGGHWGATHCNSTDDCGYLEDCLCGVCTDITVELDDDACL